MTVAVGISVSHSASHCLSSTSSTSRSPFARDRIPVPHDPADTRSRLLREDRGGAEGRRALCHKVDRLARNGADDVQIVMQIRQNGTQIVSATENIDEAPSGLLLHGIMSSLAEFYSRNLATDRMKGTPRREPKQAAPCTVRSPRKRARHQPGPPRTADRPNVFQKVQDVLDARRQAGERNWRHHQGPVTARTPDPEE